MARTIYLPCGEMVPVIGGTEETLRRLIYDRLGRDAAQLFEDHCEHLAFENECTDEDAYLLALEEHRDALQEVLSDVDDIEHHTLTASRLDREKIRKLATSAKRTINSL